MSHTPHELREDFPEFSDKIHDLKTSNNHFARLATEYHDVNRELHRIEVGEEHVSQFDEENFRKKRIILKDEIYAILKAS